MTPACVLVLGTPRSGTSLVAGILHALGVRMGEQFGGANDANPKGFWNDLEFESWCNLRYRSYLPAEVVPLGDADRAHLGGLVAERRRLGGPWGVKEWRLSLSLAEFVAAAGDVRVVRLTREAERSAASWNRHYRHLQDATPEDFRRANGWIDAALAGAALPTLTLNYDSLAGVGCVERLAAFAGRPVTAAALAFPDPSLRRF